MSHHGTHKNYKFISNASNITVLSAQNKLYCLSPTAKHLNVKKNNSISNASNITFPATCNKIYYLRLTVGYLNVFLLFCLYSNSKGFFI